MDGQARKLEDLGYSSLTVPDHLAEMFSPMPALVSAAAATKTIPVGTTVLNNDFRHPVLVAREAATVDLLTDGRLELGLGAGYVKSEYEQVGVRLHAQLKEIVARRGAELLREHPREVSRTHRQAIGERIDRQWLVEVFRHPHLELVHRLRVRRLRFEGYADLGLPARATEEQHQLARHLQGRGGAEVLFDPGEGEIDPGGDTGRGVDVPVLHPGRSWIDGDPRVAICELSRVPPVRGHAPAVQDAGFGQEECADAHRPEAASGRGDLSQPAEERGISHRAGADAANEQHGIGATAHLVIAPVRE